MIRSLSNDAISTIDFCVLGGFRILCVNASHSPPDYPAKAASVAS